jgi:hypothetical protein
MLTAGKASYQMHMFVSGFAEVRATTSVPSVDQNRLPSQHPYVVRYHSSVRHRLHLQMLLSSLLLIDAFFSQVISRRFQFRDYIASYGKMKKDMMKNLR